MKIKRLKGEAYKKNGQDKQERKLGQPCTSEFCQKSSLRRGELINEEERKYKFWSMQSWTERHLYIQTLVVEVIFLILVRFRAKEVG